MYKVLTVLMITLMSQHVHSKVIRVNIGGSNSSRCCFEAKCPCSSLPNALRMMNNNTIINITSKTLTLNDSIRIGSGHISNITITSHRTTVCCKNIMISCESCDDVLISGITWVSCIFALSNCSVHNCTLVHGNFVVLGSISIEQSVSSLTSPFWINNTDFTGYVNLTISGSTLYSLTVNDSSCLAQWNVTIINTIFINGSSAFFDGFRVCADVLYGMHMVNVTVRRSLVGIHLEFNATKGNISVSVLSSTFVDSHKALKCMLTTHSKDASTSVLINDSEFISNQGSFDDTTESFSSLVNLSTEFIVSSTITLNNVNFTSNHVEFPSMLSVVTSPLLPVSFTKVYITNVNFINNNVSVAVNIGILGPNNLLILHQCKFINNNFFVASLFLIIKSNIVTEHADSNPNLTVSDCSFLRNRFVEGIFITGLTYYYIIEITNTIFGQNSANNIVVVNVQAINIIYIMVSISASNFIGNKFTYGCLSIPESSLVYLASSRVMNNTGIFVSASQANVTLKSSNFTSNSGGCIHLVGSSHLHLSDNVLFHSNSAEKGAALYTNTETEVHISSRSNIQFVNNSATMGGAVFVDATNLCGSVFTMEDSARVTFKDNIAGAGNSLYFSVSKTCDINTNASDPTSLMYGPYRFNYMGLSYANCCEVSCSNQPIAKFPVTRQMLKTSWGRA